jgi:outer membrane murein-binding lipoprotein Lpp
MKNIFKTLFVTAVSVSLLTGCIKETFPLEGAATSEQLAQSAAGMAASVDGLSLRHISHTTSMVLLTSRSSTSLTQVFSLHTHV